VPSITMVGRLLDLADQLVQEGIAMRSPALRRRAVSTAYYAVFHSLAKSCASTLLPSSDKDSEVYERVYRALDHGPLKAAFTTKDGPVKHRESLRRIGNLVVRLQSERHRADYLPPKRGMFRANAMDLIDQARLAVSEIERLSDDDRIAMATLLLFKSRPP
jgi:uncharacterized protein (UPF0332 family)